MATSSRGDKRKAPMVEQEDIGTEEGELLDVHPPLPEPVGRSGSDRKRKKPTREEEGPLAIALLPPTAEEKRAENTRTMVAGLMFMHLHKWLHCDIPWQNVLLHFPSWDWNEKKSRADSGRDNENRPLSPLIRRSMVFVEIGDLEWAQSFEEVQKDFDPYPVDDENPRRWIAPELNPKLAIDDEDGKKYMTKFSQESDIYALGWLIREMCGDFFTDMTDEEKRVHEYNRTVYMRGLHIPNAAEVHGRLLREELERMTWKKICHAFAIDVELWIIGLIISTNSCLYILSRVLGLLNMVLEQKCIPMDPRRFQEDSM
ncbi:hypothetical protein R1sor_015441 [Riccia sorocarpa]|uniref:Protein kinase domain-containing protein n=1 Tax=Riccia sorocarpa TaxID=122646 RepID=A0ABD3HC91_9MARC